MAVVIDSWLERAAARAPGALAVRTLRGDCTYAELLARARGAAAELTARGAAPGERVAIALPAGLDFAYALHACLLLGAVAVPVDLRLGARERAAVTGEALVVDEPLDAVRGSRAGAGVHAGAVHDLDAVAAVIHTSGTTSVPKPVELSYGNFLWSALGSAVALGVDPRERWLCNLPLAHVGGLSILLRSAIYGTAVVVHERFDADLTLAALLTDSEPVTVVSLVATTLTRLLDAMPAHPERPLALRCALTGGGPVPAALLARARAAGVPVSLTYGLTEACSQVSTVPVSLTYRLTEACSQVSTVLAETGMLDETGTDQEDTRYARIPESASAGGACLPASFGGRCLPASVAALAGGAVPAGGAALGGDPAAAPPARPTAGPPLFCTRVRTATDGELEVAGPTVARSAAGPDGWLRTGDVAMVDGEGLHVTGRKADTIVSGGENVAPTEVEAVLEEHPAVLEAAVVGRADERWGEAVTALVVARPGAGPDGEELRAHCAARLAPYKVPKRVAVVAGPLPRTRSGKLLRRELA